MTVAMLCSNVYDAALIHAKKAHEHGFKPLELNIKDPVPSDIEISRNQKPKKITRVAQELGILDAELEPYGHF